MIYDDEQRKQYEDDLRRRQEKHLRGVSRPFNWKPCLHDGCPQCCGTGIKAGGSACVHMLSCSCPRCCPC